ncbi:MAG TPA: DnaJ domain-containing protein [Candidatus Melainabacteria bacterium]|nr:DnaJ domain-containing protein [Candidatus Melainabacteria bacterium]
MQEFEEDYYAILGVEESASQEEIRKAYLALAKKLHPDRFPNDPEKRTVAQSEFARVSRAHDIVSDAERRAEYDAVRLLTRKRHSQNNLSAISPDAPANPDSAQSDTPLNSTGNFQIPGNESEEENINIKWANKHLSRADDLFRRRNYKEAETALKEAIRLVPTDPRYHNKLAEVYLARGWKTLAMTEVQSALRNDPKNAEAKNLEAKVKALAREKAQTQQMQRPKKSFFEQLKEILTRKL